jgi:acetyl esterase
MSEIYVRPDVAAFLAAGEASGMPPLESLPVADMRAAFRAMGGEVDAGPVMLERVRDLGCPGPAGVIALRLYDRRAARDGGPAIVFFHGGGFVFGDLETHDSFCRWLADRTDVPVIAVDYRLAPEHPFPAFTDDAEAAARWIAGGPSELGFAPTGLIACGDSAGGHLAIHVAQVLGRRPAEVPVLAQWAIYPYLGAGADWDSCRTFGEGFMLTSEAMARFEELCAGVSQDPRFNLMLGEVPADVPLLLLTAGLDPLRDQGRAYASKARAAGARVVEMEAKGMIHGFVNIRRALPSSADDLESFVAEGLDLIAG